MNNQHKKRKPRLVGRSLFRSLGLKNDGTECQCVSMRVDGGSRWGERYRLCACMYLYSLLELGRQRVSTPTDARKAFHGAGPDTDSGEARQEQQQQHEHTLDCNSAPVF
mmetsp:Transcript_20323/g.42337  ORF Transcript_20323/g.42337 Transcript_20323/m.42337 type:complete len:109 (-) Transcript_20323:1583-1909(-)